MIDGRYLRYGGTLREMNILNFSNTLKNRLRENKSRQHLRSVLDRILSSRDLLTFLHRYTVFNGNFAGGVASLAGASHIRDDLFRAQDGPFPPCADSAAAIASCIFFAAEDEYACRKTKMRVTHRELAQFLLSESLKYYAITSDAFDNDFQLNDQTQRALRCVREGYKTNRQNTEIDLYHGLGFHLGAEILADEEFNILHEYLTASHQKLVEHLQQTRSQSGFSAYHWIKVHTYVEEEHFDISARAVEIIDRTYAGKLSNDDILSVIARGFDDFAAMQKAFFSKILTPKEGIHPPRSSTFNHISHMTECA